MRRQASRRGSASQRAPQASAYSLRGEDAVAVDRGGEGLRLAAQGMDDVAVVDAVGPAAVVAGAQAGMADDVAAAEEGLDAVIVEMDAQALAGR